MERVGKLAGDIAYDLTLEVGVTSQKSRTFRGDAYDANELSAQQRPLRRKERGLSLAKPLIPQRRQDGAGKHHREALERWPIAAHIFMSGRKQHANSF